MRRKLKVTVARNIIEIISIHTPKALDVDMNANQLEECMSW